MNTRERIASLESPVARELLTNFVDEFEANLFIPNSLLPKHKQGKQPHIIDGQKVYGQLGKKAMADTINQNWNDVRLQADEQ